MVCLEKTIQIASGQMHRSFKLCLWSLFPASWPSPFLAAYHVQGSAIIWRFDARTALHRLLHYRITSVSAVFGRLGACVGVSHASWRCGSFFGCRSFSLFPIPQDAAWASAMGLYHFKLSISNHEFECKDHSFPIFRPLGLLTGTGCDNYSSRHC